ncbi:D-alanyl-D-alanine carboxypeptidase family protein [Brevibacterium sp. BRM-1]|uniref:D-alanyl-D-alanine carboxypeptidase family protein n=1 Tax=Brevibacterium sp. BRM-1 TaxID=2999062 RepID=UPI00227ED059|nr:D-alanyl-D-alanine carboxypeptidase family protein [Brevibacterium sp. BRM-1]WAL41277.1 D-alanyl-D-alanine carboxypeptidase family protein [Brevibacterium sp. BRM-1]
MDIPRRRSRRLHQPRRLRRLLTVPEAPLGPAIPPTPTAVGVVGIAGACAGPLGHGVRAAELRGARVSAAGPWARSWAVLSRTLCSGLLCSLLTVLGILGATAGVARVQTGAGPAGAWVTPVPGFQVVKAFDKPAHNWEAGHRGIDVAALPGEPIRSPGPGTVHFAGKVAGVPSVSVEVGGHIVSYAAVDATVKRGAEVFPGTRLGTVANPSHCPSGCVHVGVWRAHAAKDYLNPAHFFAVDASILLPADRAPDEAPPAPAGDDGRSGAGAWGGHANGRIPAPALCPLATAPGQLLRCDGAHAFDRLSRAFAQRFGRPISVTDAYRDYATQVILKARKGRMAATPGRSNHGWGLAVDLGGGISSFGSAEHAWMRANAPRFGWIHPAWARQDGSLPEPWHWEFRRAG